MVFRITRIAFPAAALLITALAPSRAWAKECTTDAECGAGYQCVKAVYGAPGCADPSAGCAETEPAPEIGWCEAKPIACTSNADCPDFMRCVAEATLCSASSDGPSSCEEPDPTKRSCQYVPIECATHGDCPASFECTSLPLPCPVYDCAPNTDCEAPACTGTQNICTPKPISCTTNAECPSAWSCEESAMDCAPSGTGDKGAGSSDCGAPVLACLPTGVGGGGTKAAPESAASSSEKGGCALGAPARPSQGGAFALFASAALLALAARRRR